MVAVYDIECTCGHKEVRFSSEDAICSFHYYKGEPEEKKMHSRVLRFSIRAAKLEKAAKAEKYDAFSARTSSTSQDQPLGLFTSMLVRVFK